MSKSKKPRPIKLDEVTVHPIRPPTNRCPDWYWRAIRYVAGEQDTIWAGRGPRAEVKRIVNALQAEGLPVTRTKNEAEPVRTVLDVLELWLGSLMGKTVPSERTRKNYERAAKNLKRGIGSVLLERLDADTLDRYRDDRLNDGAAPSTVRFDLQVLRSAWRWGHGHGFCRTATLPTVRLPERRAYNDRTPTRGDVAAVLEELDGWHRLALLLCYTTGARISEIMALRWADVDADTGLIRLGRHAGARKSGERVFPLPLEVLAELGEPGEPETTVLGIPAGLDGGRLRHALTRACERAEVKPFSPHGLRRLATDELYRKVGDVSAAAAILGHSPEVALRYYRKASLDDVRAAVERAGLGSLPKGNVVPLKKSG
jgi:integrase